MIIAARQSYNVGPNMFVPLTSNPSPRDTISRRAEKGPSALVGCIEPLLQGDLLARLIYPQGSSYPLHPKPHVLLQRVQRERERDTT
jgi:hypothetical protein